MCVLDIKILGNTSLNFRSREHIRIPRLEEKNENSYLMNLLRRKDKVYSTPWVAYGLINIWTRY